MAPILLAEIKRKIFHLFILSIPLLFYYCGKKILILFFAVSGLVLAIDYSRRKSHLMQKYFLMIFKPLLRESEFDGSKLCSASYLAIATCTTFTIFKPSIAIISFFILAISDASASLIGKSIKSEPFFEKSFYGSLAFAVTAIIIAIAGGAFFKASWLYYIFAIFSALAIAVIEARPSLFNLDDNLSIPVGFAMLITFFDLMWNII